jgi:hypothetical protein
MDALQKACRKKHLSPVPKLTETGLPALATLPNGEHLMACKASRS